MFSWVFALTQTPFFIQEFVRRPRPEELKAALFDGKYYNRFRNALHWVLRHRSVTIGSLAIMLILSAGVSNLFLKYSYPHWKNNTLP